MKATDFASTTNSQFSVARNVAALRPQARLEAEERIEDLRALLASHGEREMRDDSRLTFQFASGQMPGWSTRRVAYELMVTRDLYHRSDYPAYSQERIKVLHEQIKREHGVTNLAAWDLIREYVGPALRVGFASEVGLPHTRRSRGSCRSPPNRNEQ